MNDMLKKPVALSIRNLSEVTMFTVISSPAIASPSAKFIDGAVQKIPVFNCSGLSSTENS
jgi:hypothetical protein